jgi:tetratricopeptide (TPR) repeat protein
VPRQLRILKSEQIQKIIVTNIILLAIVMIALNLVTNLVAGFIQPYADKRKIFFCCLLASLIFLSIYIPTLPDLFDYWKTSNHNDQQSTPISDRFQKNYPQVTVTNAEKKKKSREYWNSAQLHNEKKEFEAAILDYDRVIELYPSLGAYFNRANLKNKLGRQEEAVIDYSKEIDLYPKASWAYAARGAVKYQLGRKEEAIIDYNKAIEISPTYSSPK